MTHAACHMKQGVEHFLNLVVRMFGRSGGKGLINQ